MQITIEITEQDLKNLIKDHIENTIRGDVNINDVKILVKSKQNFKSEWEVASFKAIYDARK